MGVATRVCFLLALMTSLAATGLGLGESSPWCSGASCDRSLECRAPVNLAAGIYELNNSSEGLAALASACGIDGVEFSSLRAADSYGNSLPSNSSIPGRFFFQTSGGISFIYFSGNQVPLADQLLGVPTQEYSGSNVLASKSVQGDYEVYDLTATLQPQPGRLSKIGFSFIEAISDYNVLAHEVYDFSWGGWLLLGSTSENSNNVVTYEFTACESDCSIKVDPTGLVSSEGLVKFRALVAEKRTTTHRINFYDATVVASYSRPLAVTAQMAEAHHSAVFELLPTAPSTIGSSQIFVRNAGGETARQLVLNVTIAGNSFTSEAASLASGEWQAIPINISGVSEPTMLDLELNVSHSGSGSQHLATMLPFYLVNESIGVANISVVRQSLGSLNATTSYLLEKVASFRNPTNSTASLSGSAPCPFNFTFGPNEDKQVRCLETKNAPVSFEGLAYSAASIIDAYSSQLGLLEISAFRSPVSANVSIISFEGTSLKRELRENETFTLSSNVTLPLKVSFLPNQSGVWNHSIVDFIYFSHEGPHVSNVTFRHELRAGHDATLYSCSASSPDCILTNKSVWKQVNFTYSNGTLERNGDSMSFLAYAVAFDAQPPPPQEQQPAAEQQAAEQQAAQQPAAGQQPAGSAYSYQQPYQPAVYYTAPLKPAKPYITIIRPVSGQQLEPGEVELAARVQNASACYASLAGLQVAMLLENGTATHIFSSVGAGSYSASVECDSEFGSAAQVVQFNVTQSPAPSVAASLEPADQLTEVSLEEAAEDTSVDVSGLSVSSLAVELAVPAAASAAAVAGGVAGLRLVRRSRKPMRRGKKKNNRGHHKQKDRVLRESEF